MPSIFDYSNTRWEHFKLCWKNAKDHWLISMVLILFSIYNIAAALLPFAQEPSISVALPKIPLPWCVAIILAGITYMVIEGGCRLRQKELGQGHNLHLEGILKGTLGTGMTQRPKISLFFRNQSRPVDAVETVSVRAELRCRRRQEIQTVSPLSWIGSTATAIEIGAGETAELIIGVQNVSGMWDFGVNASVGPADIIWVYEEPFEFEVRLLNAKNGRPLKISELLTFCWEWHESGHTNRPSIKQIPAPAWTL